jgi:hypothetical protein
VVERILVETLAAADSASARRVGQEVLTTS